MNVSFIYLFIFYFIIIFFFFGRSLKRDNLIFQIYHTPIDILVTQKMTA